MPRNCPDCQRLWREYAAATNAHVALENRLRMREKGVAARTDLAREITAAALLREQARRAIETHEAAAHGAAAGAAECTS